MDWEKGRLKSDMLKHELGVASYELLVTSEKLKSTTWIEKVRVEI